MVEMIKIIEVSKKVR